MSSAVRLGIAVVAMPLVVLLLVLFILISGAAGGQPQALGVGRMCFTGQAPNSAVAGYGPESLRIAGKIVAIGKKRGLGPKAWQVATQAGMAESGLRNLDHGHADSLGIFQMRPSQGWGSPAQLQDVEYQINKFYDVLLSVEGWKQMRPGTAAQKVERSAFPGRYHQFEQVARRVLGAVQGIECSNVASGSVAGVLHAAMSQLGVPYAWGGGTVQGPSEGFGIDEGVVGFDCSSLVMYAYYQGTSGKITLPRVAAAQYQATASHEVQPDRLAPGDLLFYGATAAGIHHVALYVGRGKMIEAPQSGMTVRITEVRLGGDFYAATRVL